MNIIEETRLILKTMEFAECAHSGQLRWGGVEPYIHHPLRVYNNVTLAGGSLIARQAAILHDVVEDTIFDLPCIDLLFGSAVMGVVDLLTRKEHTSRDQYMKRLLESGDANALLVKYMDAKDNSVFTNAGVAFTKSIGRDVNETVARYTKYMHDCRIALCGMNHPYSLKL